MSPGRGPVAGPGFDGADLRQVGPTAWLAAVQEGLKEGRRFAGLFVLPGGLAGSPQPAAGATVEERPVAVATVLHGAGGDRVLVCDPGAGGSVPSMLPLVPAAAWDEREAHDLYGVGFGGHEPLRPLVSHDPDLAAWTIPVAGSDVHQVAVGPIHAGIIESGHFRFHVVGERILHLDVRLFHKHRGLERAAEGRPPEEALAYAQRACGACSVANGVAFAHACESARGQWPTDDLRRGRTVLLELERAYNHLHDISALCAGVGYGLGTMAFAGLKERAQRLNRELTGHRFLFGSITVGSSGLSVGGEEARHARAQLRAIDQEAGDALRGLRFTPSFQERLGEVGVVSRADAVALGAVGPVARASGIADDSRTRSPRLAYDGLAPPQIEEATGDVAARLEVRATELAASFGLLDALLGEPIRPAACEPATPAPASTFTSTPGSMRTLAVGRAECPRGETVCVVALADGLVRRMHLRTASYANWPVLAHAARDNLLPDFPLINKSFELCYACVDR